MRMEVASFSNKVFPFAPRLADSTRTTVVSTRCVDHSAGRVCFSHRSGQFSFSASRRSRYQSIGTCLFPAFILTNFYGHILSFIQIKKHGSSSPFPQTTPRCRTESPGDSHGSLEEKDPVPVSMNSLLESVGGVRDATPPLWQLVSHDQYSNVTV